MLLMSADVAGTAASHSVRSIHLIVLSLCTVINMLDGYDLQAAAFTSTHIMTEWHVAPSAMGLIFSAGLLGVGLGSLLLSPFADRYGRRPLLLVGLVLVTIGMLGVGLVTKPTTLAGLRLLTGLGIG